MIKLNRATKYVILLAGLVAALLPANAGHANAAPAPPPIPTQAQCRVFGLVTTFLAGPAKGHAATKRCTKAVKQAQLEQPLPDAEIPPQLRSIRDCESGVRNPDGTAVPNTHDYDAVNTAGSTASGGYMYLDSTWTSGAAGEERKYARAKDAPPGVQDRRAVRNFNSVLGNTPWLASASCWS